MTTTDAARGQVVADAAEVYERFFVPALFDQWPDRLLDAAGVTNGHRVLDVGCGTGVAARAAAGRVGSTGHVVAVDRNEAMLAVARRSTGAVTWRQALAEDLPFANGTFDRVVAQFVLMFVDDREQTLGEMARVTAPGGTVAVATWSAVEESPGYATVVDLLRRVAGPDAADALLAPFCLGTADVVAGLLHGVFSDVTVSRHDGVARFPSIESWVHTDIRGWTLAEMIDDETYDRLLAEARDVLRVYTDDAGRVEFPAPALIATGRAPR